MTVEESTYYIRRIAHLSGISTTEGVHYIMDRGPQKMFTIVRGVSIIEGCPLLEVPLYSE